MVEQFKGAEDIANLDQNLTDIGKETGDALTEAAKGVVDSGLNAEKEAEQLGQTCAMNVATMFINK